MKKSLALLMILLVCMTVPSYASENENYAEKLKVIEVFKGSDSGFELDREPTRLEGLIMFIRLIGAESATKNGEYKHPFTDVPKWADSYVGWAYENGYTKGVSATEFGVGNVNAKSYLTFMLRALGYDDTKGDFSWGNAIDFSQKLGIISSDEAENYKGKTFLRGHVAKISFDLLGVNKKNGVPLGQNLINEGSIEKGKLEAMGIVEDGVQTEEEVGDKFDPDVFFMRDTMGLEIAEFIKGSKPYSDLEFYTYESDFHTSKILEHGQSDSLDSKKFEASLGNVDIVRGFLFDDEMEGNLGAVNLNNGGMNLTSSYSGDYYVEDYLYYLRKKPLVIDEDIRLYIGVEAMYNRDDSFTINVNTDLNEDMRAVIKALIMNITSNNQSSEKVSEFIVSEITTRFKTIDSSEKFSVVLDNTLYPTEMYIEGYFVSFEIIDFGDEDLESLQVLIK